MMKYHPTRWEKFKFVITPIEFENIFADLISYFIFTNKRVPEDYRYNEDKGIFNHYINYYEKVTSGDLWSKDDRPLVMYTSITQNLEIVNYEKFTVLEEKQLKIFKRAVLLEPVVYISPFSLQLDGKHQLTVKYYDINFHSNLGLELSFPSEVYCTETQEKFKASRFTNYKLFQILKNRIKSISKKARVKYNDEVYKPNFWISSGCKHDLNKNVMLQNHDLLII